MTDAMSIERSGRMIPFLDLNIGAPFFAHGKYWVRTDTESATVLKGSADGSWASSCNFLIDGTVKSLHAVPGTVCEEVETVEIRALKFDRENDGEVAPPAP
jgi:hypothetical protein